MVSNDMVRSPGDDRIHLIVQQHIKLCQTTMCVDIDKSQKTAEKAHARIDETNKRLARLDDDETGKVTIMWLDKQETKKMLKEILSQLKGKKGADAARPNLRLVRFDDSA